MCSQKGWTDAGTDMTGGEVERTTELGRPGAERCGGLHRPRTLDGREPE